MSLARKTTKAVAWQLFARGAERGLKFLSAVALARLLAPDDFGRFATALVLVSVIETLSFLGVEQAIIQSRRGDEPRFLAAALRMTILRGFAVAAFVAALSPIAGWYSEDHAVTVIALVVAVSPAVVGFTNPWVAARRKALDFRVYSVAAVVGGAAQVAASLACAWMGLGALSLAIGIVATSAATVATGWMLARGPLDFTRDSEARTELRGFARKAVGMPFVLALCNEAPTFVLARMADLATVGTYGLARRLCSLPTEVALPILGTVLAPAYASMRDEPDRIRQTWLFALGCVPLITVPAVAGAVVLDERLPAFIFGSDYAGSAGLVSLLGVVALVNALTGCCGPLFWGLGRPQFDRMQIGIRLACIAAGSVPLTARWGATGLAGSIAIGQVAALLYALRHARIIACASRREVLQALAPAALYGGIAMSAMWSTDRLLERLNLPEAARVLSVGAETAAGMALAAVWILRARRKGARS
ncbi:MAG: oligosaccharide flippase family protein [Planctomycetota bacterium]